MGIVRPETAWVGVGLTRRAAVRTDRRGKEAPRWPVSGAGPCPASGVPYWLSATTAFPRAITPLQLRHDWRGDSRGVVHVVHAVGLDDYPINPDADDWEQQASAALEVQRRTVERLLAGMVPEWSYEVRRGDPVDLLAAAAEADDALMIVVGTRGRGLATALARLVDQSVSHRVTSCQRRPVLVVPHRETPVPRAMRDRS
jgi:nucleotide-binding universal stress UspA family protein